MLHKVSGLALASFLTFLTFLTSGENTLLQDACFQREPLDLGPVLCVCHSEDLCGTVDQLLP